MRELRHLPVPALGVGRHRGGAEAALDRGAAGAAQRSFVVSPAEASPEPPDEGTMASLLHSAMGKMLLATQDRDQLRALIHRHNAETEDQAQRIAYAAFVEEIEEIRTRRSSVNYAEAGGAVLAVLLPRSSTGAAAEEQIALGVFAAPGFIRQNEEKLVRMLRNTVARRLGAVRVVAQTPAAPVTEGPRQAVG